MLTGSCGPTDQAWVGEPLPLADFPPGQQCGHLRDEEAGGGQQEDVPAPGLALPQQVQAVDGPQDQAVGQGSSSGAPPDAPLSHPHGWSYWPEGPSPHQPPLAPGTLYDRTNLLLPVS